LLDGPATKRNTSKKATGPCSKIQRRWTLAATILGSSMVFIDGTVVNVALPALQTNLNATVTDVQWVIEALHAFSCRFITIWRVIRRSLWTETYLRDRSCSVRAGFHLVRACADDSTIDHCRRSAGVGGALLVPGSLAIISATFGEEERGQAIGTWSGSTAITTALGPVLGGWLIETCFVAGGFLSELAAGAGCYRAGFLICAREP